MSTALAHGLLLLVTAVTTGGIARYAVRHRQVPGSTFFAALMASLAVWSFTYGVGLQVADRGVRTLLLRVQWTAVPVITVALVAFAAAYTGHDRFVSRRAVAALGAIPALTVLAAWTNPWHHLLWAEQGIEVVDGMALMASTFGPLFWFYTIYSYALVAVAMALMVKLVFQSEYLYADQSVLVLVGVAAPFVVNVVDVFVLPNGLVVDYPPVAFAVTGVTFGYAVYHRQLFDLIPATRKIGRNAAIGQLDTGIVIVDTDRRIVYANAAAGDVFGADPADLVGEQVRSVVDDDAVDFDAEDALAELERDDGTYEIRTSPITDRHETLLGHTLVVHDVTARKRRERELTEQRDELATLNDLNAVIRGVNQALVSALTRDEIAETVCERVTEADLYRTACIGDVATWRGDADRWTVASDGADADSRPPSLADGGLELTGGEGTGDGSGTSLVPVGSSATDGTWTVVPLTYGRTVYGALGLETDREAVGDRERSVLRELGETIGHAINAVETRQLLSADRVVELELEAPPVSDPVAEVAADCESRLELAGLVPTGDGSSVAYFDVAGQSVEDVARAFGEAGAERVRVVRADEDDDGGLLEWAVTGETLIGTLVDHGANVTEVVADGGRTTYTFEVASEGGVRSLVDHLDERYPQTKVLSKRERARTVEDTDALPGERMADLTDKQREALEAAYHAGYFKWPRDSTAEDVADSLGVSSPTLHSHLRRAEGKLLADIFDSPPDR